MNIKIVVATHKKYQMPSDAMYLPLHVGHAGKVDLGYTGDDTGDNISEKNLTFCELTGLYWAWKNLDADYVGLAHYRRHFFYSKKTKNPFDNVLLQNEAEQLLSEHKILVPKKRRYYIESLYSHYAHTLDGKHLDKARESIVRLCPEYLKAFDGVMQQTGGYLFNMMVMPKVLLNEYCDWLFKILFDLESQGLEKGLDAFNARLYGRVSEILFNVWLQYKSDKGELKEKDICEVNYIHMEKIDWLRKIYSFLMAKFFGKKYEKSF